MHGTIPSSRPVLGKDLDGIRQTLGISVADACWVFGITISKWAKLTKNPTCIIDDPALALLIRMIDSNPLLCELPQYPDPCDIFKDLNDVAKIDKKTFSILLGAEKSSAHRWIKKSSRPTPPTSRLMYYIAKSMSTSSQHKKESFLKSWSETVKTEAIARGAEDIFKDGKWPRDITEIEGAE